MFRKNMICLLAILLVLASFNAFSFAAENEKAVTLDDFAHPGHGIESVAEGHGMIDWRQGVIEVQGSGTVLAEYAAMPQAKIIARRAAIVDGYHNLAQAVKEVQIDAQSTMKNIQLADDNARMKVAALIQGARIISENQAENGEVTVVMALDLYGDNSLNKIIMESSQNVKQASIPQPTVPMNISDRVTGLIVNARGLGLEPVMAVKIYDQSGRAVYGNQYGDIQYQIARGLAEYVFTDEDRQTVTAEKSRAGSAPLIIKALGLRDNNCDLVISNEDGDKILAANSGRNFIQKCAVVLEK
ncbi:hypothetical protein Ga0466249_000087 [Sporomusaceae bacterium BoRhaA]|uniref:hypothetical protein n=1 Tax=Pelorhabdus rhamnosifermentans TaxID=2772457 RepID=UPI001C062F77|nr:hypothetical protein [Pelorhabdus rhamnosifermentans]MBU2699008.1 hypothetical protein [Pelorhabdus rhamnosifermentans]